MKKRFVCKKMLKNGLCCIALDLIGGFLLSLLSIIFVEDAGKIVAIMVVISLVLIILILIVILMFPYLGQISCKNGIIVVSIFKKKYEIKVGQKVVFCFRDPWTPRYTEYPIYPMKIRIRGTKKEIPIQIIDKEVIEFLRQNLDYSVDPNDFDFNKIY